MAIAVSASLATHLVAMSALSTLPASETTHEVVLEDSLTSVRAVLATSSAEGRAVREHAPEPEIGSTPSPENVDTHAGGAGGDATGAEIIITLVSRADDMTLVSRVTNAADANQVQRIRTSRSRATPWQGRATPHPEEAPFLASGEGERRERREVTERAPAEGVRSPARRTREGGVEGGLMEAQTALADPARRAGSAEGRTRAAQGAGVAEGTGRVASPRADVAHARPALDRGLPTVPAEVIYELPRDTVDSEALTSRLTQSFVDTSRRGARTEGAGAGGASGVGDPGSGGARGTGGHSAPYAPGTGQDGALDLSAARYRTFYLALQREVERHLTFPRERALHLDQGHAVFRLILRRDGSLVGAPRLVRSTGFADLDAASRQAIERARFQAVPGDLSPETETVTIRLSVHSRNPLVR